MTQGAFEEVREPVAARQPRPVHLKPYDIRQDQERATRRHLAARTRRLLRVTTLLALDSAVALATLFLVIDGLSGTVVAALLPVAMLSLLAMNAYGAGVSRADGYARLLAILMTALVVLVQARLLDVLQPIGTTRLLLWLAVFYAGLEIERAIVGYVITVLRRHNHLLRPALVIGTRDDAETVREQLAEIPFNDLQVVGYVLPLGTEEPGALGKLDALEQVIDTHDVRVVVMADSVPAPLLGRLTTRVFQAGASVLALPSLAAREAAVRAGVSPLTPTPLEYAPAELPLPQLGVKRAMDLVLTVLALLALSPLLVLIAIAIKLDSPGPVLFRQTRVGVGGRTFQIYKFRTMVVDAEARQPALAHLNQYGDARLFKIVDDPRITRVGRWLRRSSLDELPQLFNVLMGDMSLVGPRPPLPAEVAGYSPDHYVRLSVMPGVTGPWQANGRNNVRSFDEVVRMEHEYIRNWSLALDLRILWRTVGAVVRGDGAH
ncbi:MAG: sugar transferase [Candidatus Cloacimonetes bacterium]|nr:sugar transferase [Candidatus Cloacimonadota bacterium]